MRVRSLFLAVVLLLLAPGLRAADITVLDALLQAGKSLELAVELRKANSTDLGSWLRERAEQGHPVAQYELAFRLRTTSPEESLVWYARARMSRVLDAAECARSNHSASIGWMVDLTYQPLENLARGNEGGFSKSMDGALKWESSRVSRPSPKWICGESSPRSDDGDVLPHGQRQTERRKALERLQARAKDISAQQTLLSQPINPDGFSTIDAPFVGAPIRWLDNDRLFASVDFNSIPLNIREAIPFANAVVWNVTSGVIETRNDLPRGNFCYYDGYISYTRAEGDYVLFIEGPLSDQRVVDRRRLRESGKILPLPDEGIRRPNRFSCRWNGPGRVGEVLKYPLLEGHGHLLSKDMGRELYYVPNGAREPIALSFNPRSYSSAVFSQPLNAYFFPEDIGGSRALKLWVLSPDGRLSTTTFPAGPWFGASRGFHVSRAGIVVWSHRRAGRSDDGFAGIYLARNEQVVRLMSGFVNGSEVSPDGCRIAAGLGHDNNRKPELRVVDVCTKGG